MCFLEEKNKKSKFKLNIYLKAPNHGGKMAPFVRKEHIERADELVKFARSIFNEKRSETLRKASKMYKEATLSMMAEIIEKEADDWDIWFS